MRPRITLIFALLVALLLPNINAVTQEDKLEVIASYSILADVVSNIAGDHIELTTLIPTGADPHGFQPSPRDLTPLSAADVIFVNGAGFEESLLEVIEGAAADVPIVEISSCVGIIPIGASGHMHEDEHGHEHDDDDHADEHEDEHGHEHDDDDHADEHEDDHGHDHDEDDHADEDDEHGHDHDDDDHADEHEDEHGHEHDDDDHADEHEDEHGHDHDDDDHADEADEADDDHGHDHDDDDHADEHDDKHMHDDMHSHCDDHDAEFAQVIGDDQDAHEHGAVLGRLEDIECGGHGHGHDHEEHAHEEGACDPHVWMDPHNIIYWSLMVRDVLSELDPGHAADYAAAAEDYIGELIALEADFILPLLETLPVEKRILITSHDSLGYLAASFDFVIIGTVIPGASTQVEPSASDVSALIDLVKETGVAAIFGETIVNTAVLETISAETGAELAVIYTGTLSVDGPASTYLDYMRYNLTTIVEALGTGG